MHTNLPVISSAGLFRSQDKFPGKRDSVTRLRSVVDYEIELMLDDGGIAHLNGERYPICKGDLLIAQPGDKRQSTLHFSALFVHFSTGDPAIREMLRTVAGYHSAVDFEKMRMLLDEICEMFLSFEPDSDIFAAVKLVELICIIKQDRATISNQTVASNQKSVVSDAIAYMKRYYMEPLTIEQIAKHCGVSAPYFYKLFLGSVHTSPYNYLISLRISAAKSLLVNTAMSVGEIAEKCGFNSQACFSDRFKRQTGFAPRQFRSSYTYPNEN